MEHVPNYTVTGSNCANLLVKMCYQRASMDSDYLAWFVEVYLVDMEITIIASVNVVVHELVPATYMPVIAADVMVLRNVEDILIRDRVLESDA